MLILCMEKILPKIEREDDLGEVKGRDGLVGVREQGRGACLAEIGEKADDLFDFGHILVPACRTIMEERAKKYGGDCAQCRTAVRAEVVAFPQPLASGRIVLR